MNISSQIKRLDHIHICIPHGKEDEARSWYMSVLGLTETERPASLGPGGLWLLMGDICVHLGISNDIPHRNPHAAFEVQDLESLRQHLQSHGVEIGHEPDIPGVNRFAFRDPFGNKFEFLERD